MHPTPLQPLSSSHQQVLKFIIFVLICILAQIELILHLFVHVHFPPNNYHLFTMSKARPALPFADYQRVFRVIKTVLDGVEANTPNACVFFSIVGATILQEIYKKKCVPIAGAAIFALDDGHQNTILTFGRINAGQLQGSKQSFHCWILCENQVIDFMAPIFRESLHSGGFPINCARKMFQKPLAEMVPDHTDVSLPGHFYLEANLELTREILHNFGSRVSNRDLTDVCLHWYKKPPKTIQKNLAMASDDGSLMNMKLSELELIGAW